jgi:hypothetical protein
VQPLRCSPAQIIDYAGRIAVGLQDLQVVEDKD